MAATLSSGDLLTTDKVAGILGYHVEHVRRLIRQGKIPARRISGRLYVRADELDEALTPAQGEAAPAS